MWILIANKFAKIHAKRLNRNENIPKSFKGATFFETPCMCFNVLDRSCMIYPMVPFPMILNDP